ncbi:MAG: hypothetical protein H6637_05435 [Ardenticatenales bacterium]|nr:hypothetical protein [Ardenticatenales bacterium]
MSLIDATHYPEIRAALDTTLDATRLPDSVIEQSIYLGAAEAEVLRLDSQAQERVDGGGEEALAIQRAVIYLTAARLAPAVPQLVQAGSESGLSYRLREMDWRVRAAELRAWGLDAVQAVLATGVTSSLPSLFGLASGRRGR